MEALEQNTRRNIANIAKGSAKLLAALWDEHPERMRLEYIAGRAERAQADCEEKAERERRTLRAPLFGRQLIQSVADDFGISYGELIGDGRSRIFVEARVVIIRVLRERGWSFPRIGMLLGNRDHSTIIHSFSNYDIHERRNPLVAFSYGRHRPEMAAA